MKLIIDSELLNKCGSGSSEFWFSYKDYTVKNIRDLDTDAKPADMGQTTYFVSIGLIPFIGSIVDFLAVVVGLGIVTSNLFLKNSPEKE